MSALRVRASNLRLTCFRGLAFAAQCGGRAFLSRADCLLTGAFAASGPHPLTCAWSPTRSCASRIHRATKALVRPEALNQSTHAEFVGIDPPGARDSSCSRRP